MVKLTEWFNEGEMTKEDYGHIRIWKTTLRKLQKIHGLTGAKVIEIVDIMADEKLEELKRVEENENAIKNRISQSA